MTANDWDSIYGSDERPPWDIDRPQPAFVRVAESGAFTGRLLDAGCGTGEHSLLAAASGADVVGVDISARAIEQAKGKAAARGIKARFEVGDARSLGQLGAMFSVSIDSGLFHVFNDEDRAKYVASLASVMEPGGTCYLMCFSENQPGDFGPRRITQAELRAAFSDGWIVTDIVPAAFDVNRMPEYDEATAQAWLATITRR
ncbi:MAG TPA: class I SAM-dependent methyltransferase [Streptosporangiaceae bacterium]|nr:class I SAM-dependent methyltransferase [Streptosporangiaceae bacterium]